MDLALRCLKGDPMREAEVAYEAYRQHAGGVSLISGAPIPPFEDLDPRVKAAWAAAASSVMELAARTEECEEHERQARRH